MKTVPIVWSWPQLGVTDWYWIDEPLIAAVWAVAQEYESWTPAEVAAMCAYMRADLAQSSLESDPDRWVPNAMLLMALEGISGQEFSGIFHWDD